MKGFKNNSADVNRFRYKGVLILASALLNAGMVIFGRGSFIHVVAVFAIGIYIGLPSLGLTIFGYLINYLFHWGKPVARIAAVMFVFTASLFISLIPGRAVTKHDIAAAKMYCESLIPGINRYHQKHGVYPLEIETVVQDMDVPRLLRNTHFYWSDGQKYSFTIGDPRGMMDFIGYHSYTRQWNEFH